MWIELGGTVISEGILWGEGLKPTKKNIENAIVCWDLL